MEELSNKNVRDLEKELRWYKETYEHRKLIGIIKDRVLKKIRKIFLKQNAELYQSVEVQPHWLSSNTPVIESAPTVEHTEPLSDRNIVVPIEAAFDVDYYLTMNPDVKRALLNPITHYIESGWREGRNPNDKFKTRFYLDANPDVKNANINPFIHYILHGRFEGRPIMPKFMGVGNILTSISRNVSAVVSRETDILIPVYNGFEFLPSLFEQLKRNTTGKYRLIIVEDASPDERVKPFLESQKGIFGKIEIHYNETNLGFVRSVNKALSFATNDVVILNSDTALPNGWLERLLHPIWTNNEIASVTPMTNAGTIASFPNVLEDNAIFLEMDVDKIDETFRKFSPDTYVEAPTGIGFCMAMSKKAIEKIGLFDQDAFGRGYGEENDWCMRALKTGFVNVISTALFVWHKHGGSFTSDEKKSLLEKNTTILLERHPEYLTEVKKHIERDPLADFRFYSFVDLCCKHAGTGLTMYIDHQIGGGANFYLQEKIKHELDVKPVAIISYNPESEQYQLEVRYKSHLKTAQLKDLTDLFNLLSEFQIQSFFYNNVYSFPDPLTVVKNIVTLRNKKKFATTVAIHDFYPVCQSFILLNNEGKFCGAETNSKICNKCISSNDRIGRKDISIDSWRNTWYELLKIADSILCFSNSSKDLLLKVYAEGLDSKIEVIPHTQTAKISREPVLGVYKQDLHIGIIGSINYHKGSHKIKELVNELEKKGTGKITIIGSLFDVEIKSDRLKVTGKYNPSELPDIIERSGINVFFFPSIWPETFSYVVSELIGMKVPLAAYNLGAPAERIVNYNRGLLLPLTLSVKELIQSLDQLKEKTTIERINEQITVLKNTPLFEADFYRTANVDVSSSGMDPYIHYLLFGAKEGRNPSLKFDSAYYLLVNKDVKDGGINPLIHYILVGEKQGRKPIRTGNENILNKTGIEINNNLKIAVVIHAFYEDLINELLEYTTNIPVNYSILISVVSDEGKEIAERWAKNKNFKSIKIKKVPNRGRDIAPAFIHFKNELIEFDLVCKLHSKKSLYTGGEQVVWRRQLIENLIGSEQIVRNVLEMFQADSKTGLIYPISNLLPYWAYSWLSNKGAAIHLQEKLKIQLPLNGYIDYPMGSMFWFRPEALKHFIDGTIVLEDFKEEPCGNDGTFAHAIERAIAYVAKANGFNYIELNFFDNMYAKGFGSKNLHQYGRKSYRELIEMIDSKKIVSFDIFDTLIARPLIEPDFAFTLIEMNLDKQFNCKTNYFSIRKKAEQLARIKLNTEVGYTTIYDTMQEEGLLDGKIIEAARLAEFEFELAISCPRTKMIEVYNHAIAKGKRVILVSDMYLEKGQIMQLLEKNGIKNYSYLYLSSDILKRKDNGLMWNHLEDIEKINTSNFIHIGDNEHSDIQLTTDKRLGNYHIMSAYNMFLNSTIGQEFISRYPYNWQKNLYLGPVINRLFNDPFIDRHTSKLDPVLKSPRDTGYSVFGPIILSYFIWLCEEVKKAKIDTLYFLAREGYLLKQLYDSFVELKEIKKHYPKLPDSVYLLTSRRSVLGAVDKDKTVLKEIIANNYFNGSLRDLFFNRMGVDFNEIDIEVAQEKIAIPRDTNKVLELVIPYLDQIKELARIEKESLLTYLDEIAYTSDKKVGLVDLGYSGTIQKYLYQLTKKEVKGYYFVTRDTTQQWTKKENQTFGFFGNNAPADAEISLFRYSLYLEFWLTAPDGQLSHFSKENGKVIPVFREKGHTKKDFYVNEAITDGVMEYLKDAVSLTSGELNLLNVTTENAQAIFENFVKLDLWDDETRKVAFLEDKFCGNENDLDVIKFSIGR
jgi:predicted HAD superfamily hydrolase/GT2 family glycosyltransferase